MKRKKLSRSQILRFIRKHRARMKPPPCDKCIAAVQEWRRKRAVKLRDAMKKMWKGLQL